jgi:hypothetical protein
MVLQIWLECLIAAHDIQQPRPNTPSCSVASASTYSCSIHITLVGALVVPQGVRIPASHYTGQPQHSTVPCLTKRRNWIVHATSNNPSYRVISETVIPV